MLHENEIYAVCEHIRLEFVERWICWICKINDDKDYKY